MSLPEGYIVPVYRSLCEPILIAGAPRSVTILNGTLAATIGLGLQLWLAGILFWFIAQGISVWMTKQDDRFLEVSLKHVRYREYLSC